MKEKGVKHIKERIAHTYTVMLINLHTYIQHIHKYIHPFEYKYLPTSAAADGGYVASKENPLPRAQST